MQDEIQKQPEPQWPCHPESFRATFLYKIPMFALGVIFGFVVYALARVLFT